MRTAFAMALAIGLLLSLGAPTEAAQPSLGQRVYNWLATAPHRMWVWHHLTRRERRAFKAFEKPVSYVELGGGGGNKGRAVQVSSTNGVTCWTWTHGVGLYNAIGWHIWDYKQKMDWCEDGSTISNSFEKRWGET